MFDEEMLSLFARRESVFVAPKKEGEKVQQAWNRVLDARDVIESRKALYGEPSDKELESLYVKIEKILKEHKNGNSTQEDESP